MLQNAIKPIKSKTSFRGIYEEWILIMTSRVFLLCIFFFFAFNVDLKSQTSKQVREQYQSWFALNTLTRISGKWGIVGEIHIRRNHFIADNSFYFIRLGANYWVNEQLSLSLAYGHMWLAPTVPGWFTFAKENRIHQQLSYSSKIGRINFTQRLRNEQRWQQIIINDEPSKLLRFTNRVRYLMSLNIPVFKNQYLPALVLADEIMIQFGKDVVYNTFDQNRLFIGLRQKISHDLNFDIGYMRVFQQRISGFQYDLNHTFRLYFYYTPDLRKIHLQNQKLHNSDE